MNEQEFFEMITELTNEYGKTNYGPRRVEAIYLALKI